MYVYFLSMSSRQDNFSDIEENDLHLQIIRIHVLSEDLKSSMQHQNAIVTVVTSSQNSNQVIGIF